MKSAQEAGAGGEAQAGGDSAGGSSSQAGAPSAEGGSGGEALGGGGGGGSGDVSGGAAGATAEAGAGAGGAPDSGLPSGCPGALADYTVLDGTADADTFDNTALEDKKLVFGLEGADVFDKSDDGGDCLVGGPGDDELTSSSDAVSYLIGGEGADLFHLDEASGNYAHIVDMTSEDEIGLSRGAFPFLAGQVGATPSTSQLYSVADYEAGTGEVPSGEGAAIVYDPGTGGLWMTPLRGTKDDAATPIATIVNHGSYTFAIEDFVLED